MSCLNYILYRKVVIITSALALLALSACAPTGGVPGTKQAGWEHVHDGFLIGNIYTGDDHI